MYPIEILYVKVINNNCKIDAFFVFEILYEIKFSLQKNFEIKVIYVTSPKEKNKDQELDSFQFPANKIGKYKILIKTQSPQYNYIKPHEILEVSIILLTFCYQQKELIRIGYYLNNEIVFNEHVENIQFKIEHILRKILSDKPRITYYPFN